MGYTFKMELAGEEVRLEVSEHIIDIEGNMSEGDYTEALRKLGSNYMRESHDYWRRYGDALKNLATDKLNPTDIPRQYIHFIGKEGPDFINKLAEQNIKYHQFWLSNCVVFMERMFDSVLDTGPGHDNSQTKK